MMCLKNCAFRFKQNKKKGVYRKAILNFKKLYLRKQQSDNKVLKGNFKNIFSTLDFFFARELFLYQIFFNFMYFQKSQLAKLFFVSLKHKKILNNKMHILGL